MCSTKTEDDSVLQKVGIGLIVSILLLTVICLLGIIFILLHYSKEFVSPQESSRFSFRYWRQGSKSLQRLTTYVQKSVDRSSTSYIPPERRIAVMDFDGTLFCETNPGFFDVSLYLYKLGRKSVSFEYGYLYGERTGSRDLHLQLPNVKTTPFGTAFANMTLSEFDTYVRLFAERNATGFSGMKFMDGFYLPMKEVLQYLQLYNFKIYICTGSDRFLVRTIVDLCNYPVPSYHIIGTDYEIVGPPNIENPSGTDNRELLRSDALIIHNLDHNKVLQIVQEIHFKPVLSFGNSEGDFHMNTYVTTNNTYPSLAFMLIADDNERDYGNEHRARRMRELVEQRGWIPISMKEDFLTIYEKHVTKLSVKTLELQ